jgi:DUF1680 family protein
VLDLDLPVRVTEPDPRMDAVRGCAAVERGPLVYCVESVDQERDVALEAVAVDAAAPLAERPAPEPLVGAIALEAQGHVRAAPEPAAWPYAGDGGEPAAGRATRVTFVPYNMWGNRGPTTMRLWVPAM